MKNLRCYYSKTVPEFLSEDKNEILGEIHSNVISAETTIQQGNTWKIEIEILRNELRKLDLTLDSSARVSFEYTIPRMGKRVDNIVLYKNIVFILEFKCGDSEYRSSTYDQVYDYALDLKNFHRESHDKLLVPIMISTNAPEMKNIYRCNDSIFEPLKANSDNIGEIIMSVARRYSPRPFDYCYWENSEYLPTPTIIEAASALYSGHNVSEITRSDAGATNLTITTDEINKIIDFSKKNNRKSICFVTGVPGAGKTLVGLNIAIQMADEMSIETGKKESSFGGGVFLSGNFPLVTVLQEALARDKVAQEKNRGGKLSMKDALRSTSAFIQVIHKYRDSFVDNDDIPPEHVVIFDEAQRAWTKKKIAEFMATKKGIRNFEYSEPEFLIQTMDRHSGYGVVICLVGGGQEINDGEAGLPEWFNALRQSFPDWDVYVSPNLNSNEYTRDDTYEHMVRNLNIHTVDALHLSSSVRSFRTPDLAAFVKAFLDENVDEAKRLYRAIKDKYPIVITRDLSRAKQFVKNKSKGTTRYGILASSRALRLKPEGIFVKNDVDVGNWFLNDKTDVRSSYAMEDVVTEFEVQGLELDYTVVAWDGDFRYNDGWSYNRFIGSKWQNVKNEENILYLKNTYRVLLTRARQGMAIFIPKGSDEDKTRDPSIYDGTYNYLKSLGVREI